MSCRVRIEVDHAEVQRFLCEKVGDHIADIMERTKSMSQSMVNRRSGLLSASHYTGTTCGGGGIYGVTGAAAPYAMWVHQGTSGPITPKSAKLLRLRAGNGYPVLYRRSVRGQQAQRFLVRAFLVCCPYPVEILA